MTTLTNQSCARWKPIVAIVLAAVVSCSMVISVFFTISNDNYSDIQILSNAKTNKKYQYHLAKSDLIKKQNQEATISSISTETIDVSQFNTVSKYIENNVGQPMTSSQELVGTRLGKHPLVESDYAQSDSIQTKPAGTTQSAPDHPLNIETTDSPQQKTAANVKILINQRLNIDQSDPISKIPTQTDQWQANHPMSKLQSDSTTELPPETGKPDSTIQSYASIPKSRKYSTSPNSPSYEANSNFIGGLTALQSDLSDVASVQSNLNDVTAVQSDLSDVASVQSNLNDVTAVQSDLSDVASAQSYLNNVTAVQSDLNDVPSTQSNLSDVTAVQSDLNDVLSAQSNLNDETAVQSDLNDVPSSQSNLNLKNQVNLSNTINSETIEQSDFVNSHGSGEIRGMVQKEQDHEQEQTVRNLPEQYANSKTAVVNDASDLGAVSVLFMAMTQVVTEMPELVENAGTTSPEHAKMNKYNGHKSVSGVHATQNGKNSGINDGNNAEVEMQGNNNVKKLINTEKMMKSRLEFESARKSVQPETITNNKIGNLAEYTEQSVGNLVGKQPAYLLAPPTQPGSFPLDFQPILHFKNNISYCWIHKNCHSQFKALLCLDRCPKFRRLAREPTLVHIHTGCKQTEPKLPHQYNDTIGILPLVYSASWHKLAILRDPFDRFISGYIDRCIRLKQCFKCTDVHCFAKNIHRLMTKISKHKRPLIPKNAPVNHLLPQYWYCDFQQHLDDYKLLMYSKEPEFGIKTRDTLTDWGFNPQLIWRGWTINRTEAFLDFKSNHASSNDTTLHVQMELLKNMATVELLFKTYAIDYFHFKQMTLPKWLVNYCLANESFLTKYEVCRKALNGIKFSHNGNAG